MWLELVLLLLVKLVDLLLRNLEALKDASTIGFFGEGLDVLCFYFDFDFKIDGRRRQICKSSI